MSKGGGPGSAAAYPIFEGKPPWGEKFCAKKNNSSPKKFLLPSHFWIEYADNNKKKILRPDLF